MSEITDTEPLRLFPPYPQSEGVYCFQEEEARQIFYYFPSWEIFIKCLVSEFGKKIISKIKNYSDEVYINYLSFRVDALETIKTVVEQLKNDIKASNKEEIDAEEIDITDFIMTEEEVLKEGLYTFFVQTDRGTYSILNKGLKFDIWRDFDFRHDLKKSPNPGFAIDRENKKKIENITICSFIQERGGL